MMIIGHDNKQAVGADIYIGIYILTRRREREREEEATDFPKKSSFFGWVEAGSDT